jgi:hypothetical protein
MDSSLDTRYHTPDSLASSAQREIAALRHYGTCPVASVPAAEVEGAVLDHVQKLLAAELVARTWATTKREGEDAITEREETVDTSDLP